MHSLTHFFFNFYDFDVSEKKKKKNYDQKILNDVSTKDQAQRVAEGLAIKGQ